ncbi:MAG TPA: alpha/beta hydrolase [Stellaceae bacterium]|nr:alpha/beta hydrolase [Stellaceae bacterium]
MGVRMLRLGFAALLALAAGTAAAKVGTATRPFVPPEPYDWRGAASHVLLTTLWYPADPGANETPQQIGPPGEPPRFEAGSAAVGAALPPGPAKFPLILLSHGTGGAAVALAWLGTALAAHGYVVAAVNHPGNNALEPYTTQGFTLWWERARDLSAVLDALLADRQFGPRIDPDRIGAAGHSLGGFTVIEVAGGIGSSKQLQAACTALPGDANCEAPPEFSDLGAKAAALAQRDPAYAAALQRGGASHRDPRIRAVFAMAPALGPSFTPESLKTIAVPVAIVAGADDRIAPPETSAKFIAGLIPNAKLTIFPGAVGHYVFTDLCTEAGRTASPALCVDAPGVDRESVHRQTAEDAIAFFDAALR